FGIIGGDDLAIGQLHTAGVAAVVAETAGEADFLLPGFPFIAAEFGTHTHAPRHAHTVAKEKPAIGQAADVAVDFIALCRPRAVLPGQAVVITAEDVHGIGPRG